MANGYMFGELKLFKDKEFFANHQYGNLYFDGEDHGIEIVAHLDTHAYDINYFTPAFLGEKAQLEFIDNILKDAYFIKENKITKDQTYLVLITCSSESTNGRDIVIAVIIDEIYENDLERTHYSVFDPTTYDTTFVHILMLIVVLLLILLFVLIKIK